MLIICASIALPVAKAAAEPLGPGDRGRAVKVVQRALGLQADGIYGRQTVRAVRSFQREEGLVVTGTVDGATRAALFGGTHAGGAAAGEAPASGDLAAAAQQALGRPYEAGADGPEAFDCSGLVAWVARSVGIELPRSSYLQYKEGLAVERDGLIPGDLVFFDTNGPGASDVGIAVSATEAISATTHGVREHTIFGPYWGKHYLGARRVTGVSGS